MRLKTRLLIASSFTVLLVLAVSEWLSYRHTAGFLRQHEIQMQIETDPAVLVKTLGIERQHLLTRLASLHLIHAGVTVVALAIVLNVLWYRLFIRRLEVLLSNINVMRLGTWSGTIPVEREDELGQLARAFNGLGAHLTLTVQQFASASKLSAMALLGHGLVRKIIIVKDHVAAVSDMLDLARAQHRAVPVPALRNLRSIIHDLEELSADFEAQFARQVELHSTQAPSVLRGPEAQPKAERGSTPGRPARAV